MSSNVCEPSEDSWKNAVLLESNCHKVERLLVHVDPDQPEALSSIPPR